MFLLCLVIQLFLVYLIHLEFLEFYRAFRQWSFNSAFLIFPARCLPTTLCLPAAWAARLPQVGARGAPVQLVRAVGEIQHAHAHLRRPHQPRADVGAALLTRGARNVRRRVRTLLRASVVRCGSQRP